jgi:hypothetical protein
MDEMYIDPGLLHIHCQLRRQIGHPYTRSITVHYALIKILFYKLG